MRFRYVYMGVFTTLTMVLMVLTNPDNHLIQQLPFGAGLLATLVILMKSVLYIAVLHLSRKGLLDFIPLQKVLDKAMESPEGAARIFQGVMLAMIPIAFLIYVAVTV